MLLSVDGYPFRCGPCPGSHKYRCSTGVTGPLGQGILQRGPEAAPQGLRSRDMDRRLMRGRGSNWATGKRPVRH